jgi:hypothetical protein
VNHIASGIMEGSRFGLRGTEDIGGGYKAIFTLENRFELDTGSVSNRPAPAHRCLTACRYLSGLGVAGFRFPQPPGRIDRRVNTRSPPAASASNTGRQPV